MFPAMTEQKHFLCLVVGTIHSNLQLPQNETQKVGVSYNVLCNPMQMYANFFILESLSSCHPHMGHIKAI